MVKSGVKVTRLLTAAHDKHQVKVIGRSRSEANDTHMKSKYCPLAPSTAWWEPVFGAVLPGCSLDALDGLLTAQRSPPTEGTSFYWKEIQKRRKLPTKRKPQSFLVTRYRNQWKIKCYDL